MKKRKGFTLVELIAVITILALLMLLVIPNVSKISDNSTISLRESKIKTIETLGEKFGNTAINQYQNCVNYDTNSVPALKNECSISVSDLVMRGYIDSEDDDYNILDPKTRKPLTGKIFMCYNPAQVSVEAVYVEENSQYSCSTEELESGPALNLSALTGRGYVGGEPVEVNIIKSGIEKNGFRCESSDRNLATCDASSSTKLVMNITSSHFNEPYKEVKITLYGKAKDRELKQDYTLVIYNTELDIDMGDAANECIEQGKSQQFGIVSSNAGELSIRSTDEDILKGDINQTTLTVIAGEKTGLASIFVKESNGQIERELKRRVYTLKPDQEIPGDYLVGNTNTINLDYGGNDFVNIKSSNSRVFIISSSKQGGSSAITLNGDSSFVISAVGAGKAILTITGNKCGKIEKEIVVTNLYVKDHEAKVYVGGSQFRTEVVGSGNASYSCSSSDSQVASCSVVGTTVNVIPGANAGLATITVTGSKGGNDTINVETVKSLLALEDEDGNAVTHMCSSVEETANDRKAKLKFENIGTLGIASISDINVASADIINNELVPYKQYINDISNLTNYKIGYNTGIVKIKLQESNAKTEVGLDYYVYDIDAPRDVYEVTAGERHSIEIPNYASGPLSASSSDPSVAVVTVDNPGSYSYERNAENKSRLIVDAIKTGDTVITLRGATCGEVAFVLRVIGHTFTVKTLKGTYTDFIGEIDAGELSCATMGTDTSCEVTFPDFKVKSGFKINGFSRNKDAVTFEYSVGEKMTLTADNDGMELYANAIVKEDPVCEFRKPLTSINAGETNYVTMMCNSLAFSNSKLTKDSFIISNEDAANIVSVGDPVEIVDEYGREGYTYKIGIDGKDFGASFDLTLREGVFVDQFGKKNSEAVFSSILVGKYNSYKFWYVGRDDPQDAVAVLYINKDLPDDVRTGADEYYTLMLYGTGATRDYNTGDEGDIPPWIPPGYQEYISGVVINEGITEIGSALFYALYNLESIIIPEGVTKIGYSAFAFSKKVKNLVMPSTLVELGESAFEMCTALESVKLNNGLRTIGSSAFKNHYLKELTIPNTVTEIGSYAFFSDVDGEIDEDQIAKSMRLEKIEFEANSQLQFIDNAAFKNNRVTSLRIPASVKIIGFDAFSQYYYFDSNLKDLTFEENSSLTNISSYAFAYNCIENLVLPDSVKVIANFAFDGIRATTINIGPNVTVLGQNFALGNNVQAYIVDSSNSAYTSLDGVIYTKDMKSLFKCPPDYYSAHTSLDIPAGVTTVVNSAFAGWIKYEEERKTFEINFPSTITELHLEENFEGTIISAYNINSSSYISENGVLFSKDKKTIYRLPTHFNGTSYTVPDTVTSVASYFAYANNGVLDMTIPGSVKTIGDYALVADPNYALKNIYLDVEDDVQISESALWTFMASGVDATYLKNVYVKSDAMINKIRSLYPSNMAEINLIKTEG